MEDTKIVRVDLAPHYRKAVVTFVTLDSRTLPFGFLYASGFVSDRAPGRLCGGVRVPRDVRGALGSLQSAIRHRSQTDNYFGPDAGGGPNLV